MRRAIIGLLVITLDLLLKACNTTEPPIQNGASISIKLFDVSVTEAYLYIEINSSSTRQVELLKDNVLNLSFNLVGNDTILLISDITEQTNYKFKANLKHQDYVVSRSEELSITTLAPTSNNFTWQVFTFGNPNYGYSVLRDVSVIDENYIWVVGKVYLLDSLGQTDTQVYGAGYWNGSEWDLMKVPYSDYGNPRPPPSPGPLFTISTINNKVFVTSYANLLEYNNENWIERAFFIKDLSFDGQVLQMYAYNEDNIYCVGRNGTIYHITNSGWNEIESGTETTLKDIWGCRNPVTGEEVKYIAGTLLEVTDEFKILKMNANNEVEEINWDVYSNPYSIWSNNSFPIFVSGSYLYSNKNGNWERIDEVSGKSSTCIRGTALNDIIVCGSQGLLAHYNGVEWKRFDEIVPDAIFISVAIKGNTICAVGELGRDAIIVLGRRAN